MPEPTLEAWAQIRHDYEHTARPLAHICAEHDITIPMMRYRMKRWEWKRRKPLIPRQGPPPAPVPIEQAAAFAQPTPTPPPPGEGMNVPVAAHSEEPAAIVPRLQSAVARLLPAIEATIARLASGSPDPRAMEQAGRTLGALTRALRELNALLAQYKVQPDAADPNDDPIPENIDDFRIALADRITAFVASRRGENVAQLGSGLGSEAQK